MRAFALLLLSAALCAPHASAHEGTRPDGVPVRFAALDPQGDAEGDATTPPGRLALALVDAATGRPIAANVRVVSKHTGAPVPLAELHGRPEGWHSLASPQTLRLAPGRYRVEAFRGLRTELASAEVELARGEETALELALVEFAARDGWFEGNTHLHVGDVPLERAKDYLQVASAADGLDLVWVSHLTRVGFDHGYASNGLDERTTHALATADTRFGWGQEHRHNFPPYVNGYGHVLLLDIPALILPVSLGPVLAGAPTDGVPLRPGIERARAAGGATLWAHNQSGFEDIPSWLDGVLDAQNVWDGGSPLGLEESLYRYLDVGLRVPLSSGTDWWIGSLNRVRVELEGAPTREAFLAALALGRSSVTSGPLLDLQVEGSGPGGVVALASPGPVRVALVARGRARFDAAELLHNGIVVARGEPEAVAGHWEARIEASVLVTESSWLAARVPEASTITELGGPLLAHTSAVAVEIAGLRRFDPAVARGLALEMDWNRREILRRGTLSDEAEASRVLVIYDEAIQRLEARLPFVDRARSKLTRWLRSLRDWISALLR